MGEYSDAIKKYYKMQTDNDEHHRLYTEAILVNLTCALADLTDEVKALREEIACAKQQPEIEKLKSELKRCCHGPRY